MLDATFDVFDFILLKKSASPFLSPFSLPEKLNMNYAMKQDIAANPLIGLMKAIK